MTFANDYYFSQNQSSVKEYHNFNTSGNDYSYDANGNMTKDLDRKIYTIRYNVLNLPEVIQFKDGHQIINAYDASGQKLSSRYYTVMLPTEVPLSTLQPGDVLDLQYNMDIIDETGTFYVDNKEYSFNGCDPGVYMIHKVYNTEGYANNIQGYYGPNYQYYRKDHLGNNREVWRANTYQTIQKTQYYPSGLPWVKNSGDDTELPINANTQKYNDKEFVEMHGLDEYDSEARWYYPAIMRTTTMDPLAEKYYDISPYVWCGNNPVRNIDPDGRDIWEINNEGNIVNRTEDKTQDAFYMVEKDDEGNYQRTFTSDDEGNKTYNSITFEYGTIESQQTISLNDDKSFDVYKVRGDDNGTALFEFMGKHVTGSSSKVEVSQAMTGIEGDKGLNFITTSHEKGTEAGMTHLLNKQLLNGYHIRELNHTHPVNNFVTYEDIGFANQVKLNQINRKSNVPLFHIYHVPSKTKTQYAK